MKNPVKAAQINVVYCPTVELLGARIKRQGRMYLERCYAVYFQNIHLPGSQMG